VAGAEDKALLGSTLSADSGAKTKLGLAVLADPRKQQLGLASVR